jgi:protein-S-isoprenylcysteine O-methyltransferase Ste14
VLTITEPESTVDGVGSGPSVPSLASQPLKPYSASTAKDSIVGSDTVKSPTIYPPVYFFAACAAMVACHVLSPVVRVLSPPITYAGVALIVAGFALALIANHRFVRAGTTVKPFERSSAVVSDGPFRYGRNPMYLGMFVALFGLFVLLGTLSSIVVIPVFYGIIVTRFVRREERHMEEQFGDAYLDYKRRVRRWL